MDPTDPTVPTDIRKPCQDCNEAEARRLAADPPWNVLIDAVADSNRVALENQQTLHAIRNVIFFAVILYGAAAYRGGVLSAGVPGA